MTVRRAIRHRPDRLAESDDNLIEIAKVAELELSMKPRISFVIQRTKGNSAHRRG
jgi:hypothetical protein